MSPKHVQWLLEELPTLVSKNVLPAEAAQRVRQYYGESTSGVRGRPLCRTVALLRWVPRPLAG